MKADPYGPPEDVTLRQMVEAMASYRDDETFRYFQPTHVASDGSIHPTVPTLRVTVGQVRRELGIPLRGP